MKLAFKSSTELMEMITSRQISSFELLEIYIERYKKFNKKINALISTNMDNARLRAKQADLALQTGEKWGRLHGLPITIKDNIEVVGMPCTSGSSDLIHHMPDRNADLVQRLVDEGAIVFGKTNLPLFGDDFQTHNEVFGQTNNPWDHKKTPGGSSGGSAAALATGLTALDIGNDIGGSIRIPASFCGIYGHKPSYGIIPDRGLIPPMPKLFKGDYAIQTDIAVNGPLARSAEDLDLALKILVSPELPDKKAWRIQLPEPRKNALKDFKIGVWLDDPVCPVDSSVGDCLQASIDLLAKSGATISNKKPDISFEESWDVFIKILNGTLGFGVPPSLFEKWLKRENDIQGQEEYQTRQIKGAIQRHRDWLITDCKRQVLREKWARYFKEFDILLCPVTPVAAFSHNHTPWFSRSIFVNNQHRPYSDMMGWTGLTNVVFLPSTIAPSGFTPDGLPVGIQIVGPYLEDRTPIQLAKLMGKVTGGFIPPSGYH